MDFVEDRNLMEKWALAKGPQGLEEYRQLKNRASIDNIPGCPPAAASRLEAS
jgi:hypothetical protein